MQDSLSTEVKAENNDTDLVQSRRSTRTRQPVNYIELNSGSKTITRERSERRRVRRSEKNAPRSPKPELVVPEGSLTTSADQPSDSKDGPVKFKVNPKVKVKKADDNYFGDDLWNRCLSGVSAFDIPASDQRGVYVSREWMSANYGGSQQGLNPPINRKRFRHGLSGFTYIHLDYHPMAPQIPGRPGLFFDPDETGYVSNFDIGDDPLRVFSRVTGKIWQFVGIYKVAKRLFTTKEDWRLMKESVRTKWGKAISTKGWGREVRARVDFYNRHRRKPTKDEYLALIGDFKNVTAKDVKKAFSAGRERMAITVLQCVNFDTAFADEMLRKLGETPDIKVKKEEDKVKKEED